MFTFVQILRDILEVCRSILKLLRLRQPGLVFLKVVSEEGTMLKFKVALPPPGAPDVVSRNLSLTIGDEETMMVTLPGSALESEEYIRAEGTVITGSLSDVDDAGNVSPARDFSLTLVDTIAPPMPGEVGLTVTEELPDEVPDPDPLPDPDPETDPADPDPEVDPEETTEL